MYPVQRQQCSLKPPPFTILPLSDNRKPTHRSGSHQAIFSWIHINFQYTPGEISVSSWLNPEFSQGWPALPPETLFAGSLRWNRKHPREKPACFRHDSEEGRGSPRRSVLFPQQARGGGVHMPLNRHQCSGLCTPVTLTGMVGLWPSSSTSSVQMVPAAGPPEFAAP